MEQFGAKSWVGPARGGGPMIPARKDRPDLAKSATSCARNVRPGTQVRVTGAFSQGTVDGLKAIKYCAMAVIGFVAGAVVFIIMFGDPDDRPAGIYMSFLVTFASGIIAVAAAIFSRKLINTLSRSEGMS
jgi:hypothetical protein